MLRMSWASVGSEASRGSWPDSLGTASSSTPCMAWMTEPAARNRQALKQAWVTRWNTAAPWAPTPSARNMNPSWLMVE